MRKNLLYIFIILGQLLLIGCASATGPLFTEAPRSELKEKVMIYFYRNSQAGSASTYDFQINEGATLPLMNKGYYLLVLEPGTYDFKVSIRSKVLSKERFTLNRGETYYLRFHVDIISSRQLPFGSIGISGHKITSDSRDEAIGVLKECRLIEPHTK